MKKVMLLLICLLLFSKVYAYENEYFHLELDESFKEQTAKDKYYIFSKGNEYISITINDNKDDYDISKFKEEDINKQKEYLIQKYKDEFKDYTSNITLNNINVINTNDNTYLEYDMFFETKKTIGYNIYQRCRMYTSNNYIYSILYNSDKEIDNNNYLDTFIIKDSYLKKVNIWYYSIGLVLVLAIILLIDYLIYKKRH